MVVAWDSTEEGIWLGCFTDHRTNIPVRLIVEKLPRSNKWDWVIWCPHHPFSVVSGKTQSAPEAALEAEQAIELLVTGEAPAGLTAKAHVQLPGTLLADQCDVSATRIGPS
jgi:hypothetical protein